MSQNMNQWQRVYNSNVPNDTGITSPEGYNIYADPTTPYVLTSSQLAQGAAPLYLNPAASLYTSGNENTMLLSSSVPTCDTGCVASVHKPDPRVFQVKPLYKASSYSAVGLPTAYNVVGMY